MHNKEPDHGDSSPTRGLVRVPIIFVLGEDAGNDEMAGSHSNSASDENWLSS